jgi:hypothetical protein
MSTTTVFAELRFWLLVVFSVVVPFCIYGVMLLKRAISRATTLIFGFGLVLIAGIDVYLLQSLASAAKVTASLADDRMFLSELSIALYVLPLMFGGIGVNVVSNVLLRHLVEAQRRFDREHSEHDMEP